MTVSAIIVAGGKGVRMDNRLRKQYVMLGDRPILSHTLGVFAACDLVHKIILVIPKGDTGYCETDVLPHVKNATKVTMVPGGEERQDSVYFGLEAVEDKDGIVLIHDGVRPFVRMDLIKALIEGAEKEGACIPGIPAFDTLKKVNRFGIIEETAEREGLYLAQTPQAFQYPLIRKAHDAAKNEDYSGTDDASLAERFGFSVRLIQGCLDNIKITTKEELKLANAILFSRLD